MADGDDPSRTGGPAGSSPSQGASRRRETATEFMNRDTSPPFEMVVDPAREAGTRATAAADPSNATARPGARVLGQDICLGAVAVLSSERRDTIGVASKEETSPTGPAVGPSCRFARPRAGEHHPGGRARHLRGAGMLAVSVRASRSVAMTDAIPASIACPRRWDQTAPAGGPCRSDPAERRPAAPAPADRLPPTDPPLLQADRRRRRLDRPRTPTPGGDTGRHEPHHPDAITDAELQRSARRPRPPPRDRAADRTARRPPSPSILPASPAAKRSARNRWRESAATRCPGGDSSLRNPVWELMRPMLSPGLAALKHDAFVLDDTYATSVDLATHRAASSLDDLDLDLPVAGSAWGAWSLSGGLCMGHSAIVCCRAVSWLAS